MTLGNLLTMSHFRSFIYWLSLDRTLPWHGTGPFQSSLWEIGSRGLGFMARAPFFVGRENIMRMTPWIIWWSWPNLNAVQY